MKKSFFNIGAALIILQFVSCDNFLDVGPPKDRLITDRVFTTDENALSVLKGIYIMLEGSYNTYTYGLGLYSDEFTMGNRPSSNFADFQLSNILSNNVNLNSYWTQPYLAIYSSNLLIEQLAQSSLISDHYRQELTGNAKFLRALAYFNLVNTFGDVPLILTTDYRANEKLPRTSTPEIYAQIIQDLGESKSEMSDDYLESSKFLANRWAAVALLARVYLYTENWEKAEIESTSLISSGRYTPLMDISQNIFTRNSKESILQYSYSNSARGNLAVQFIPASSTILPTYILNPDLINSFEEGDLRKQFWTSKNTIGGVDYYYPTKYKDHLNIPSSEAAVVLRAAEQYLIRAEARAQMGKTQGALQDVNVIRNRAGLPLLDDTDTSISKSELLRIIEEERRHELFQEMGHRWFDLRRTQRANEVIGSLKPNTWRPTSVNLPIPLSQLDTNPFLTQNPGYDD